MYFLYQIVTSSHVYTLYEEESYVVLHVLNLRTKESSDALKVTKMLDILNEDAEVTYEDIIEVEDAITSVLGLD